MTKIKLIAIDLDETLLDDKKQISEANIKAIRKAHEQGIKIVISSGRPEIGIKAVLNKLGLLGADTYFIAYNGTRVYYEKTNTLLYEKYLTGKDIKDIYKVLPDNLFMHFYDANCKLFATARNPYTDFGARVNNIDYEIIDPNTLPDDGKFIKLLFTGDPQYVDEIIKKIPTYYYERFSPTRSAPIFFEFLAKGVSKGDALTYLINYLGLKQNEVCAMGDNDNDYEMLEVAGKKIAMENSLSKKVLDIATFITKSNNNSGVAYAIEKILNEEI